MTIRPRRSVLYMPGSNARALEKAKSLACDCIIIDLEDAVAPDAKEDARARVVAAVSAGGYGRREVVIRINAPDTPWGEADIAAAATSGADAVLVPKVSTGADVATMRHLLTMAGAPVDLAMWAMMETPLAILNAGDIAAAGADNGLRCLVMGTNDLAKETDASLGRERMAMLTWLSISVAAARAHGLAIVDGVYNDFRDTPGFDAECRQGRALGMDGKTLIHPSQIELCNEIFSPSELEVAEARRIIEAFDAPENAGKGAININGRMVERLHADMARRKLALHEACNTGEAAP